MESAFGQDFGNVRAHVGGAEANEGLSALGAKAAAHGQQIAFNEASPGREVVAHELAHVLQQRGGGGGLQAKPTAVSASGDAAEQRADEAAAAVVRGEPVPDLGTAPSDQLHRLPVETNGGTWDTTNYAAHNSVLAGGVKRVGCDISLKFTPNTLVEADNIGLTQTVRTLSSTAAGGAIDTPRFPVGSPNKASIALTAGDKGRAIDQGDSGDADTLPNTNPLYAVENTPGHVSATLTDVAPDPGFGTNGHRKKIAGGAFDVAAATLTDGPRRRLGFAGEEINAKFESTALVLDGPMRDTYLGSVEWGYKCDAAGTGSLDPASLQIVRSGAPTSAFMDAARKWNSATFTDPSTGTVHSTVDLPTTTMESGGTAAGDMRTADIIARIAVVNGELKALAAGTDRTNKEFEKRALETELQNRRIKVTVFVKKGQEDPDDVYVQAEHGGRTFKSSQIKMKTGSRHVFWVPLSSLFPVNGKITVKVFDRDLLSADDMISIIGFDAPYSPWSDNRPWDDAEYETTVEFEK